MDAGYSYPAPAGSEAEFAPGTAPDHPNSAPYLLPYLNGGQDGEEEGGGQYGEAVSHTSDDVVPVFSEDEFREILETEWGYAAFNGLLPEPAAGSSALPTAGPAPMAEMDLLGPDVPLGSSQHPGFMPAVGPPPVVYQPSAFGPAAAAPDIPGFLAAAAPGNAAGPIAPQAHATSVPPAGIVVQQPLYPPGFRIQDNLVLRHDWPQGLLQPSPRHFTYERSGNPKPAQDNAVWCNSCEYWLWEPCYERAPLSARDRARCCNRCHWRKKSARGMGLHEWMLAAQPRMMHLLKKDAGYVA
ncbi:uncharacterized protein GLRG_09536 [Colletotrichum graminicola M1.001]|uniref:Uncharacterized protein n=1 Tax=Colletotrichum graminicola (strain M1.001 / M2 / FGSC 10212) TaxID=645133 RepID=E3QU54_COLGM|nr:uncharacterized protein GLRG_09536 [Colletotrichum graminicola M1.001]EFQ34392.1 hypothetical protein GLRG_09536 [Colletotrichum graminicola M1.001]